MRGYGVVDNKRGGIVQLLVRHDYGNAFIADIAKAV